MASVTEKPQPESPPPPPAQTAEDHLVDRQIGRTRRALKLVDVTAGLITLAIGVLAYLLTMAVLEHWVIPGGWSETARSMLFAALVLGVAVYSWRKFWPLLRQPINPAYAALAIEQSSPSLKNSLLNLLLLRSQKRQLSRQVYQAIEQQAAQGLSKVRMETVVDRSAILRLGYILVALTAVCVLYRFLSPKDLFSSAGRVLLPWSSIATPSRVTIGNITPGATQVARGEQLDISAEVLGLDQDEPVRLLYSTTDKQIVRQEISMSASASGTLFKCRVPARLGMGEGRGVQQDFTYWIEAGDARSPHYAVTVFARPTMVVNRLRYDYPAYTGYPSREVEHTGDIRAVEGTRVTLFAEANKPIKTAHVDFEADGRRDLLMNATDQQASVTFPLALRDDRRTPRYQSYVLRYLTTEGTQNQHPPKYQIDVQPDYSPEIQLLLPEEAMLEVALNKEVNFELEARDPDFALGQVMLVGKVGEEQKLQAELLTRSHTGKFVGKLRKTPAEMGLQVGDILEYWGVAADNRQPEPNLAYSAHRKLRVTGPWQGSDRGEKNQDGKGENQPGEEGESQTGEGGQEGQAGGGESASGGEGEEGAEGESGQGQQGDNQNEGENQNPGESASAEGQNEGNPQANPNGNSPHENEEHSGENGEQNDSNDPSAGEPSQKPSAGEGGDQGKVSPEGDDDGSAFERMAEHFKEQSGESGEGESKSDGGAADGQPDENQTGEGNNAENPKAQNSPQEGDQNESENQNPGESASAEGENEGAPGDPAPNEEQNQDGTEEQPPGESASAGGEMSPEQGEPGAGEQSGDQQGAPNPEGGKKPQEKQGESAADAEQENSEAPSETGDNSESDSESSQGGDRSGGGKEGAGQQADADGKGGAGENQAADEGAGQSSEKGEGETGQKPGDQAKAADETGESSGDQPGQGSEQNQKPGEQPGGETANEGEAGESGTDPSEGQPAESQTQEGQSGEQKPSEQQNQKPGESDSAEGSPQAGNPNGTGGQATSPPSGELQTGDDANLDYAKKQTDLILDRLDDQLKKQAVDKALLEKLGWTQDELRRFVDRWKNLKSQADETTGSSDELNDALRSLGLNRNRRTGYQSRITKDKLRDLQEAYRGRVPLEYQDQVNRYLKGTATSQEKE